MPLGQVFLAIFLVLESLHLGLSMELTVVIWLGGRPKRSRRAEISTSREAYLGLVFCAAGSRRLSR
jgi:hypothetical protein